MAGSLSKEMEISQYQKKKLRFLCDVFYDVYGSPFVENVEKNSVITTENHILLQKAVYFLQYGGLYCGDYSFDWAKYGPASNKLANDKNLIRENPQEFQGRSEDNKVIYYSHWALEALKAPDFDESTLNKINNHLLTEDKKDSSSGLEIPDHRKFFWQEIIASMHYLKTSFYIAADQKTVQEKLTSRKQIYDNELFQVVFDKAWEIIS
jgi:hypothetical protein